MTTEPSVITPSELEGLQRTTVRNDSIRTLQRFDLDTTQPFEPQPLMAKDMHGNDVPVGITGVNRDPATGEIISVNYVNPKDSTDKYAVQKFDVKEGVLVLPTSTTVEAMDLAQQVRNITGGGDQLPLTNLIAY